MVARRIVRVSFFDPDATDSDSSDGEHDASSSRTEIKILLLAGRRTAALTGASRSRTTLRGCAAKNGRRKASRPSIETLAAAAAGTRPLPSTTVKRRMRGDVGAAGSTPKRRCPGVYERQAGRWAADFRDHRLKVRQWLGTFASEEEAMAAYDAFEAQFRSSVSRGASAAIMPSQPPPPLPVLVRGGVVIGDDCTLHPSRHVDKQQADDQTTTTSMTEPSAAVSSSSSATATAQNPLPHAEELGTAMLGDDPFLVGDLAFSDDDDLIGLADLGDLPLPFLDGNVNFDLHDLSLFDVGFS